MTQPVDSRSPFGLQLIGGFKVVCAVLMIGLALGVFRHIQGDPGDEAEHLVAAIKLDPGNRYVHAALEKVSGLTQKQLWAIEAGTYLYALLYLIEGTGLLLKKRWAEYFTVLATGLFIPVEVWEVFRNPKPVRVTILVLNVAIVAYVVYAMRKRGGSQPEGKPAAP